MSSNSKIKVIDLFAGAGGLSNGFEQTGRFEVAGAVELNTAAANTFIKNHNNNEDIIIKSKMNNISDITQIDFYEVIKERNLDPENLIVIGGPPCQGFSNANRQKNYLISGNNQLIKEFVRAIQEIMPKAFLMENVKTMNSDTHKFFVTEHIDNTKFAFSSEAHLDEILRNGFLNEDISERKLWKKDEISLIETKHKYLEPIFLKASELEKADPIIPQTNTISRFKKIINRSKKSHLASLINDKELAAAELLRKELKDYLDVLSNEELHQTYGEDKVVIKSLEVLEEIIEGDISSKRFIENFEPLVDLNTFLFHIKELKDEKIVYSKLLLDSEAKPDHLIFKAQVKSYNIVEYLECMFNYLGYSIDKNILTASNFGVPQKRNRFMMLGVKKNHLNGKIVELSNSSSIKQDFSAKDAIEDLEGIEPQKDFNYDPIPYELDDANVTKLQLYYRREMKEKGLYNHVNTKSNELSIKRFKEIKNLKGKNFHNLSEELKTTYANSDRTQNTIYLRLNYDEPSPTVVNVRKSMWNHPKNAVAISIREAARLQSFKDDFIFYGSKDQQYQQVGNAVPPLMARGVAEQLLSLIGDAPVKPMNEEFETNTKIESKC